MSPLISIRRLIVSPILSNCFLVYEEKSARGIIIDPGDEGLKILKLIKELGLSIQYILNTHGHIDHIGANEFMRRQTSALIGIHRYDAPLLESAELSGASFLGMPFVSHKPDFMIREQKEIDCGSFKLEVIHTPGHSEGSCCFFIPDLGKGNPALFTGDTLFMDSVGRTDLPGGDSKALNRSLASLVHTIPGAAKVFPGHGSLTTLKREKECNPYLRDT